MIYSKKLVTYVYKISCGAKAAIYHHYGIKKYELPKKLSGIYKHSVRDFKLELVRGFDEEYLAPHSRYTEVRREDIEKNDELMIVSESEEAGVLLVRSKDGKQIMATGH